jgi:hypothetical protein
MLYSHNIDATDTKLLQMEAIESKTRELIAGWEESDSQAQVGICCHH